MIVNNGCGRHEAGNGHHADANSEAFGRVDCEISDHVREHLLGNVDHSGKGAITKDVEGDHLVLVFPWFFRGRVFFVLLHLPLGFGCIVSGGCLGNLDLGGIILVGLKSLIVIDAQPDRAGLGELFTDHAPITGSLANVGMLSDVTACVWASIC